MIGVGVVALVIGGGTLTTTPASAKPLVRMYAVTATTYIGTPHWRATTAPFFYIAGNEVTTGVQSLSGPVAQTVRLALQEHR